MLFGDMHTQSSTQMFLHARSVFLVLLEGVPYLAAATNALVANGQSNKESPYPKPLDSIPEH